MPFQPGGTKQGSEPAPPCAPRFFVVEQEKMVAAFYSAIAYLEAGPSLRAVNLDFPDELTVPLAFSGRR